MGVSLSEQKEKELEFFSSVAQRVNQLNPAHLGINALKEFLQDLLHIHIKKEIKESVIKPGSSYRYRSGAC
jgi:hypothetical protein